MKTVNRLFPIRSLIAAFALLIASPGLFGQANLVTHCLTYEPTVVRLQGTLVRETFPGPPNYESVKEGDRPETYWLLNLRHPICVDRNEKDPDVDGAVKNVRAIQLVVKPELYKAKAGLVGKRVVATGTLFGAVSGHHHTPVLLTVSTLAEP